MKNFTLLALLLGGASLSASAQQVVSISAARAQGPNATVTVRGVVTNGPELGVIRYLQDATAGLAAYSTSAAGFAALVPGDSIQITGTLKNYNGLLEIDPVSSVTRLAQNRPVQPIVVTAANYTQAFVEANESRLVRINGATSLTTATGAAFSTFAGNTNYLLNGVSGAIVRTNNASNGPNGIVGKPAPAGPFDLTGIMSQFATSGVGGYQLLPRLYSDIQLGGTPNIISHVAASNLSQTGLTLHFTTQNAGDTQVQYGTSPTALTQTVSNPAVGTHHSVALTGLQPATVYYVRVSSTNAVGTSTSQIVPVITVSQSSGTIKAYFNRSVDVTKAFPGNPAKALLGAMDDTIIAYIGRARQTLDISIYSWDNNGLANMSAAVNAAAARGVRVRVVYQNNNSNQPPLGVQALSPSIRRVGRGSSTGIMHNKFMIIDAESANPNVPIVWTGSTNWTDNQILTDPNSVVVVQDQSLARTYVMEFEEMWGSNTDVPGTPVYGEFKRDNTPHYFLIGGKRVESWFSPSDNVNTHLIETIQTANNDLHVATMLMTRTDVAAAIRDQISANNMANCSEVLLDDTVGATTSFRMISSVLGNRIQKYTTSGIMHHKHLMVDAGSPGSDPTTWVGSHNWSNAATTTNDENTLVIHDANITNQFYQELSARISTQTSPVPMCLFVLSNKSGKVATIAAQVYPNPAQDAFRVKLAGETTTRTATLVLRDMMGRSVLTRTLPLEGQELNVDVTGLAKGVYQVQVETPAGLQVSRVVVQ